MEKLRPSVKQRQEIKSTSSTGQEVIQSPTRTEIFFNVNGPIFLHALKADGVADSIPRSAEDT